MWTVGIDKEQISTTSPPARPNENIEADRIKRPEEHDRYHERQKKDDEGNYPPLSTFRVTFIFLATSAITSSRLILARLPASAGIVTEVPRGRLFGGSLGSDSFFGYFAEDVFARKHSPQATIIGMVGVVSENKIMVCGNCDRVSW